MYCKENYKIRFRESTRANLIFMTRSGKLKSYWSFLSNVVRKSTGTSEEAKTTRRVIKKLTGVKLKTFDNSKQVRKALKKWKQIKEKLAREYQKEVFKETGNKITLKQARQLIPDFNIDGTSSEDFPTGEC